MRHKISYYYYCYVKYGEVDGMTWVTSQKMFVTELGTELMLEV